MFTSVFLFALKIYLISICVFSTLNGRDPKITNFPNGPEALDNPQASTIRGNWPKISPKWASKVCRSARCVGCLVGCVPDFCGKGKGRET